MNSLAQYLLHIETFLWLHLCNYIFIYVRRLSSSFYSGGVDKVLLKLNGWEIVLSQRLHAFISIPRDLRKIYCGGDYFLVVEASSVKLANLVVISRTANNLKDYRPCSLCSGEIKFFCGEMQPQPLMYVSGSNLDLTEKFILDIASWTSNLPHRRRGLEMPLNEQ